MTTTGERGWSFNRDRLELTLGIDGKAQASDFMNATLQSACDHTLDFSVAVHVSVPDTVDPSEEALADFLGGIFAQIVADHPELSVQIQIGPFGDADDG